MHRFRIGQPLPHVLLQRQRLLPVLRKNIRFHIQPLDVQSLHIADQPGNVVPKIHQSIHQLVIPPQRNPQAWRLRLRVLREPVPRNQQALCRRKLPLVGSQPRVKRIQRLHTLRRRVVLALPQESRLSQRIFLHGNKVHLPPLHGEIRLHLEPQQPQHLRHLQLKRRALLHHPLAESGFHSLRRAPRRRRLRLLYIGELH